MSPKLAATSGPWETRLLGIITVALVAFGIIAVYGASSIVLEWGGKLASSSYAVRQLGGALIGVAALLVATRLDYRLWRDYAWLILGSVALLLLILVLPFTDFMTTGPQGGSSRWINLRVLSFQPSELAKFAVIVWTAMLAAKKGDTVREFKKGLLPFVVVLAFMGLLILLEPDLSTTLLMLLLAGIVLFTAGARIGHFMLVGLVALPFLYGSMEHASYQLLRVMSFLGTVPERPELAWQSDQSLIGFGAGGLFGMGFGQGLQKLGYLPLAYSDFIFSAIGEEWGFVGVTAIVLVYGIFIVVGFRIARTAPDRFGMLLATGITALIGVTALTHMAVTLSMVPTTGLPLPFISHGRSNLIVSLFATGVLINVGNSRFRHGRRR